MNTKVIAAIVSFIGVTIGLVYAFGSWGTIDPGHRGVVIRMGAVTGEVKPEGFYTKTPFVETVVPMDVRQQKEQVSTEGASKDLQTVKAVIALNLSLSPASCSKVYQEIGKDYLDKIVAPAMQESIKAVLAQYTAEELISKRESVRSAISKLIAEKLLPFGIKTEALNIVDLDFSNAFNAAIEAKVTAEQNALAAKNTLAQKEFEAQQVVATAKGKAEAMQIESAALMQNQQVLQLRAIEKWNGILPQVIGDATPFIDLRAFSTNSTGGK